MRFWGRSFRKTVQSLSIIFFITINVVLFQNCSSANFQVGEFIHSSSTTNSSPSDEDGAKQEEGTPPTSSPTNSDAITPVLKASRIVGTAPMAVHFDASESLSQINNDSFRQLTYSFDFGDAKGQTWATTGLSKNSEIGGPIAAHVFDQAGTYTIKVQVTDLQNNVSYASLSIQVNDPNTVFSGTSTVCVSNANNFTGCPSGAAHQSGYPVDNGWSGKRFLFARGETFGDISIQDGNELVQIGAYGSGAPPIINSVGVGSWRPKTDAFATDVTVMDLSIKNGVNQSLGKKFLLYRNDLTSASDGHGIYIGGIGYWAKDDPYRSVPTSSFYHAHEIFIVENSVTGSFNDGGYNLFGDGAKLAILGNVMGTSKYHTIRITKGYKGILAHNNLKGINPSGTYHSLKIHSGGVVPYSNSYVATQDQYFTDQLVVANNTFGNTSDSNQWTVAICPQNGTVVEGIRNVLIEKNKFIRNSRTVSDLILAGSKLTYRNNSVVGGGNLIQGYGHDESLPAEWKGPYYSQ